MTQFGTSGIRGPVGETVTAEVALSVGRALGIDCERVVVGRDPRASGEYLQAALVAGLRESGVDVVDLGGAATPTIGRAVAWQDADAGVAVTASHNPPQDNGIKLWQPSGQAFDADLRETIEQRLDEDAFQPAAWDESGDIESRDASQRHVEALVAEIGELDLDSHVVVDLGNGAGRVSVDALSALGCSVETLNGQPDGAFPGRPSEPKAENCESLATLVAESDADLGIAHDGDADRMRAVSADGTFLSGDVLLAVFARTAASPGERVAVPVDTSLAVEDHLSDIDVAVEYTPVGDVYVAEAASEDGVAFGGEPSGAWIWPERTLCPDGPLAACTAATLDSERPLGDRAADVPEYPIRRDSVETAQKETVMDRVRETVTDAYDDVTTLDGVRVDLGDAWFLLRASGTQPLVRITAEARDADRADAVFEEARTRLTDALA
ncbi:MULTISPECIES: phosphoglucosamine mutase [Haloarcula]|uniref:phosphoglucosamine mutase n=1 Tax=Haloarcula TaxID=2237 RepID=UPI0005955979|nr:MULTISPECIES: phosphoglucosamine mutase [Haloarcula]AJF25559.1 phosphoglucosamine mutase [Haloarcula sp. CBA1115]KAA9405799.1 phosphoglucosamine mutase [Haloarcula sp. CBA1131]MUV49875.1 phosphoglucosamine mutase [Haloarcula sp. CBA1122]